MENSSKCNLSYAIFFHKLCSTLMEKVTNPCIVQCWCLPDAIRQKPPGCFPGSPPLQKRLTALSYRLFYQLAPYKLRHIATLTIVG